MQQLAMTEDATKIPSRIFALSPQDAALLAVRLSTLGIPPSRVKPHVVALGYRSDGVTVERVLLAYAAHRRQG